MSVFCAHIFATLCRATVCVHLYNAYKTVHNKTLNKTRAAAAAVAVIIVNAFYTTQPKIKSVRVKTDEKLQMKMYERRERKNAATVYRAD